MSRFTLEQFNDFLRGVDLTKYRERFSNIKIVEMDLPRSIQALQTIYEQYWDNKSNLKSPPNFDTYYDIYWSTHKEEIEIFRDKVEFGKDCDCFKKGLKARIYRTWASLITQIQGGYVAESVFGKNTVKMSAELDYKKIDILVVDTQNGAERLKIQIKKETHRPEIARMHKNVTSDPGIIDIYYVVVKPTDYENPHYKRNGKGFMAGDEKPFVRAFVKWYPETGIMDRLPNGFTIFTKNAFLDLVD